MSEEMPIWRQAIKDDQHPLNKAAWTLFSRAFNVERAAQTLASQKDDVIGFCTLLLDSRELYPDSALGNGSAPVHAVELLCEWKVEAVLPRLLQILDEGDWETIIYGTTADAIAKFGTVIVDPLLERAAKTTNDQQLAAIAGTLADAAPGEPRSMAFIKQLFDSRKQDFDISYLAENVLVSDRENGAKWLENRLRTRKYSKEVRQRLEKNIADAKAGKF
jgi:hypothetical protein